MLSASKVRIKSAPKLFAVIAVIAVIGLTASLSSLENKEQLLIGSGKVSYEISQTSEERKKGLSNRVSLGQDHAMLFIFEKSDYHGIWMKEMKFSIDIAWLDSDLRVVHIEQNVSPNSFPEVFRPNMPALYVLETNSGWLSDNGVDVGSVAKFD